MAYVVPLLMALILSFAQEKDPLICSVRFHPSSVQEIQLKRLAIFGLHRIFPLQQGKKIQWTLSDFTDGQRAIRKWKKLSFIQPKEVIEVDSFRS